MIRPEDKIHLYAYDEQYLFTDLIALPGRIWFIVVRLTQGVAPGQVEQGFQPSFVFIRFNLL